VAMVEAKLNAFEPKSLAIVDAQPIVSEHRTSPGIDPVMFLRLPAETAAVVS